MTEIDGIEIDSTDVEWPGITTICGSMRFYAQMMEVAAELTLDDEIVLAPFCVVTPDGQESAMKNQLDELHLRKIDMAYRIVVVTNTDGYLGASTLREMAYATQQGKQIEVRHMPDAPVVEIDGRRMVGAGSGLLAALVAIAPSGPDVNPNLGIDYSIEPCNCGQGTCFLHSQQGAW